MKYATLLVGFALLLASIAAARAGDFRCPNGVVVTPDFRADKTRYTVTHGGDQRDLQIIIKQGKTALVITVNGRQCEWDGETGL